MSRRLIVRAAAEADLADAITWCEARRTGLGREFLVEADVVLAVLHERQDKARHLGGRR